MLKFRFHEIAKPELTNIFFDFDNFLNPWSTVTIESINIKVYRSNDCTGNPEDSQETPPVTFWPIDMPDSAVKLMSTSDILGDSSPNVNITISITPTFTVSKTGRGMI